MIPTDSPALALADFDRWITQSWQTDQRYYQADIMQDLFGTWLVRRSWGGLRSRLGNSKIVAANSYDHALELLSDIAKRRKGRGYDVRLAGSHPSMSSSSKTVSATA